MILLKDGVSRAYGTVEEVQEEFGGTVYRVTYDGVLPASNLFDVVSEDDGRAELAPRPVASEE